MSISPKEEIENLIEILEIGKDCLIYVFKGTNKIELDDFKKGLQEFDKQIQKAKLSLAEIDF